MSEMVERAARAACGFTRPCPGKPCAPCLDDGVKVLLAALDPEDEALAEALDRTAENARPDGEAWPTGRAIVATLRALAQGASVE